METGTDGQNVRTLVALVDEVDTALPVDITIDWIGYTDVPDKILEEIKKIIGAIDGAWIPRATELMNEISQVEKQSGKCEQPRKG